MNPNFFLLLNTSKMPFKTSKSPYALLHLLDKCSVNAGFLFQKLTYCFIREIEEIIGTSLVCKYL